MTKQRVHIVSLGCAKNTVDSASIGHLLQRAGYDTAERAEGADVIIVNTCGFIEPARQESLDELTKLAAGKKSGQKLIAAGCLTQRMGERISDLVQGLDGVLGTRRWMDIAQVMETLRSEGHPEPHYHLPVSPTVGTEETGVLRAAVQGGSAYLEIADGCRRPCAFCAIPLIKGPVVSRSMDSILEDARLLRDLGICEINLIAQDTTDYGTDLGMKDGLAKLLEAMVLEMPEVPWIRVLYAYPGYVTDRLIDTMAAHKQLVPYLDMPLQHAHPDVLRRMRRPANMTWVHHTIEKMRTAMPDLALRSTFIVGYPGETEAEFEALLDFVTEIRFDRVGVFTFSFERGTASEPLGDPIPTEVKEERRDRLMALQQGISLTKNEALIGRTFEVLIEGLGDGISIGRTYRDAPEIDGMVIVEGEAPVGEMVSVRITGALPYDLTGFIEPAD
jgi:ribosomal protein S12 methylthiotransferase